MKMTGETQIKYRRAHAIAIGFASGTVDLN